jgi:RNA polymerase sigma factor (sigma-70 family)
VWLARIRDTREVTRSASSMPPGRSDPELVDACRRGDSRAWHELVRRYRRLVYGVPRIFGLQPADADEVFQQTFVSLLRSLPRLRDPERLEAWLVTTAKRNSLRLVRGTRRRNGLAVDLGRVEGEFTAPDPARELEEHRQGERLMRAVEALGEPCRGLIAALFADPPRPYRDVAATLGLAIGSLGPMRARCLDRLRTELRRGRQEADGIVRRAEEGRR